MGVRQIGKARITKAEKRSSLWDSATIIFTPNTPVISSPANASFGNSRVPALVAGAFVGGASDYHDSSDWQIATDSGFSSVVWQSISDSTNKTSVLFSGGILDENAFYFARVRYRGVSGRVSEWSSVVMFKTAVIPASPAISSPVNASTSQSRSLTLVAGDFSGSVEDTHSSSDWQISSDAQFSSIVWEASGDIYNKTSVVPSVYLKASTSYYARVRYNALNGGTSAWSSSVLFTTDTALPSIGSALGGGYYTGTIVISSVKYYVIVSPKASGQAVRQWKTSNTSTSGTTSVNDGMANSSAMNNTTHPAAYFCRGLTIGGYTDWYLPSQDELELCYRNLKPGTVSNNTSWGVNPNSDPVGSYYTTSVPAQTTVAAFRTGGGQDFIIDSTYYWPSTENSSSYCYYQGFNTGGRSLASKTDSRYARAVRKIKVL